MKTLHTIYNNFAKRNLSSLRLLLAMLLTLTASTVWGALSSPYECVFKTTSKLTNNQVTTGDVTWTLTTVNGAGSPTTTFGNTNGQSAIKLGSGRSNYFSKMTLKTSAFSAYNVSKVVLYISSNNGGSKTITVKQGDTQIGTGNQSFTGMTWVTNCTRNSTKGSGGDLSIEISSDATATFIHSITVTYEETSCSVKPTVGNALQSITVTENSIKATIPISAVGGCNITENGLVYSTTNSTPTVDGSGCTKVTTTACGSTAANKTVTITGLTCGQSYYIRGYATNEAGTSYTNVTTKSTSDCPKYTVTLMDDTDNPLSQTSAGTAIDLPSRDGCDGYAFAGWTKSWSAPQTSWTTTAPILIPAGSYTPTANENLYPVYTKTEGGGTAYEKVTTLTEGVYVMVSEKTSGTYKYMPNTTSSGSNPTLGSGITMNSGKTSLTNKITEEMLWDLTTTGTANQYYLRPHGSTTIGLGCTTSTGANIRISTSYKDVKWTITTSSNYGWQFKSNASTAMYLAVFADDNWRNYTSSTTNQNGKFYLFKQTSSSTTSYISVPDCDPCNALQAPNVTAKNITTNSFTLSWAAVPGATSYNVYNYTTDEGYETTDLTYTFNGLDPNTEYDWEVEAVSATCNGKGTTGTTTTLKTYTITWKNADDSVLETDENVPHGTTPTYDGETPTQAATEQYTYTFSGWSPEVYAADKDQIYTAQFDETTRQYTVTFDANGHGTAPDQQSVDYGTKATEPTEPTAFGYTFDGWYKEAECTNVWDFATDEVTSDITLYAQWTEKDLTNYRTACDVLCYGAYSFHTGDDDVKTKNTGTCFEQLDNTIEWQITNYTIPADKKYFVGYLGYYYDDNLGTNNARSAVKTWAEEMYIALAMDSDDATNSPKLGQATGAVGTLRIFDNSNWNNLYVGFIPDGYKLKFGTTEYAFTKTNGTEYRSEAVVEYNSTTADKNVSVGIVDADGKYVVTNHSQEMIHIFVKDNCGWRNDDAKLAIYYWGGSEGWCGFLKTVPGDETLFEGWIPSNATDLKFVRYNSNQSNPGSWDYENAIWNSTGNLTIDGNLFTITDWGTGTWSTYEKYGQFAMHDNSKSKNWYVHFIPHNALKYDKNANEATGTMNVQTVVYDAEDKNVTVAECGFTRTGYRFVKWRKDNTNTYYNSGVTIDLDKDITLYAQWEKEYTVTYNANGGVTTCVDNNIYIKGDEVTVCTENPSKEGHTFLGWSDGTNTYSAGATFTMPASDVTLTAQWQINQYTVTLNPNYPAGKTGTFTDKDGNTINGNLELIYDYNTASKTITDLYQSIELDGYKFNGWFSATVGGSPWTQTGEIKKNVTVYAQWTKLYGITLSENGTTKELEPQTSTSYTLPTELSVGTCDNDENELVGWSTVTIPTPGDKPTTDFYDLGETVTLTKDQTTFYAVFAKPGGASVWAKTDIANIDSDDEVVITMKFGKTVYALTNGNGTSKAPAATVVEVEDNTILPNQISDEITWNIEKDNNNLTIHPNGITNKWLYCTNANDGVRVGTNDNKVFTIDAQTGYMKNNSTARFVGVYTGNPDWRCYTNTTGNIANQTLAFYTKTSSLTNYTTTCLSKHSIIYDFNGGEGNCENEKVTHGEDYTICDEEPTKAGYTFLYWANGEDTYAPGTTIENVQADITLTATWQEKYTLTFNDQGDTKEFQYIESLPVEMQEPWADICSGPIQYVFDGWATASVNNGPAEYEKVDFSTFTMPAANTTLYAVYRYAEEGGEPVNGYVKVTEALSDWSGDYVIVDSENLFAIKNAYRENTSSNKTLAGETVTIENDKVISPSANIVWTFSKNGDGYTMYSDANKMYAGVTGSDTRKAILSSEVTDDCIFKFIFDNTTRIAKVSAITTERCFQYYVNGDQKEWRTYYSSLSQYNTGYLYRLSNKTIRYTSSLICGSITAEDALVTSTKDQKVKVKVPITLESSTGATTINATSDNAAFDVTGLTDVEAGDHAIVVEYTPAEYNTTETANITLSATNGATTTFTVTGRSLPEKFAMVVEKDGKYYALSANMPEAATYAGYEVEVKDNAIVTAPATYVYSLSAVHNSRYADYGTAVRFVGNDNKCLWASKEKDGTNIRNFAEVANATSDQYEWNLSTTDGETYTISSSAVADAERILRLYNQKFGMYKNGVSEFYFLPLMASTEDAKVLSSAFSVSATEKVQFSAGNLQYHTGDKAWRFAPEQYEYVGDDNANIGEPTFEGWIDMFGWSADGKYGVNTSINNDDYQGEFVDWGTLFPDEWYTLSKNEWNYLLNTRANAANLKQLAKVGDVYGVLLFPDEWVMPYDVTTPSYDEYNRYSYSLEDWQKLEAAGAVFLPAAGRRKENLQYNTNEYIYYWTSTIETQDKVYYLINCNALGNDQYEYALPQLWHEKGLYGQSVRLARKLMPLQVVEWKENSVVVMYNGDPAQTATVTINNEQKGTTKLSDVQKDIAVYELPVTGLASSPNQPLEIAIGTAKVTMTIPYIATATTTNVVPNNSDLVVLKDATFTATNEQLRNVTVYGGGTLVVGEGATLSTNSLTLRAGGVTAEGNYDYVYPQFLLKGTWSNTSGKINLDYLTTREQYYTFVAPFEVQTKDIHYPVDIYGSNVKADNKGSFEFEYYDGATRATGVTGWKTVEEDTDGATLEPGQGYTFLGMPKKVSVNGATSARQTFGIHRIPMTVTAADAIDHENREKTITVAPHPAEKNINAGWNLIGNPYMSTITGLNNESIQTGTIVWNDNKWEWSTDETYNQRFIVFPSNDGQWYTTAQASNATLPAFKNFFVQIIDDEAVNALVIPHTSRTNPSAAPARHAAEEIDRDIELAIVLEKDEQNADQMDFLLNNTYGPAFDRNADFTKMMNNTNFNLYGVHMDDCLSFVAIDQYTAAQPVAIGYQVPTAGEYMLRMSDKPYVMADRIKALYVTDHEMTPEVTTDILKEPYRFTVGKAETNHTRFTISIELKPNTGDGVTTGWENVDVGKDQPIKFIYQDKLYILRNGVIYDATGKFVQTINK